MPKSPAEALAVMPNARIDLTTERARVSVENPGQFVVAEVTADLEEPGTAAHHGIADVNVSTGHHHESKQDVHLHKIGEEVVRAVAELPEAS